MNTDAFKAKLLEEKARLEKDLGSVGTRNPLSPSDWDAKPAEVGTEADTLDESRQQEGYDTNNAILKDLEVRYSDVLAALIRIEDGTYGVCEEGGESIAEARLAADPAARTCTVHMN